MARSASSIQVEIDQLETFLQSADSMNASASADGVTLSRVDREKLQKRLDRLYIMQGRANGSDPMFARGRVRGLRDA